MAKAGSKTIVVVDDEDLVREVNVMILTRLGYRVLDYADGDEALAATNGSQERIHLLLTDVVLNGMSGPVLAERMCRIQPGLKVLFTSGYNEDAVAHPGALPATMAFIAKPYTIDALAAKVRALLDAEA
jgi:DNA-binding NtrC family response regulator